MYVSGNPKTKAELKRLTAPAARVPGALCGPYVFSPGPLPCPLDGPVTLEGPHYAHTWYATAVVRDGFIVPGSVR